MKLLDFSAGVPMPGTIRAAGYDGVLRYLPKRNPSRVAVLTRSEYLGYLANGLAVGVVYEETDPKRPLLGYEVGKSDAAYALDKTRAIIGQEPYCIYIAVDFIVGDTQRRTVSEYMRGVKEVLGDRAGIYGYRWTVQEAARLGVNYFWQTGRESDLIPQAQIWQNNTRQVTVDGIVCDINEVQYPPNFGEVTMATIDNLSANALRQIRDMFRYEVMATPHGDADKSFEFIPSIDPNGDNEMANPIDFMSETLARVRRLEDTMARILTILGAGPIHYTLTGELKAEPNG